MVTSALWEKTRGIVSSGGLEDLLAAVRAGLDVNYLPADSLETLLHLVRPFGLVFFKPDGSPGDEFVTTGRRAVSHPARREC